MEAMKNDVLMLHGSEKMTLNGAKLNGRIGFM